MTLNRNGAALITGASSGVGAAYAERLARRGYDLTVVAGMRGARDARASGISDGTGRAVEVLEADLTKKEDLARIETIVKQAARLTMLVSNAGVGTAAPLLQSDVDTMEKMIWLNIVAATRLTYAAVPAFVARGNGTLINISSSVAISPEVLNGVYGGTKAFLLALSQSLHHELAGTGVRVQVVLPGATSTEFWNIAGMPLRDLPAGLVIAVWEIVGAALTRLHLGRFATIPSLPHISDWDAFEAARRRSEERRVGKECRSRWSPYH